MIDLHSHILPGIDDGAADLGVSLEMARIAVDNGVEVQACTPHILPGLYNNSGPQIRLATQRLQRSLDEHGIALQLITGADAHLVPDFMSGLKSGHILSLADTRYVLVEPPHHVAPPRIEEFFFNVMVQGYVPVLTHPERLTWIEANYSIMEQMCDAGVWMQITAGSLTGVFGRGPLYWAERMLKEGRVHVIASDAHGVGRRRPNLREGRDVAARWVGEEEAEHLVVTRPRGVLADVSPAQLPPPPGAIAGADFDKAISGKGDGRSRKKASGGRGGVSSGERNRSPRGLADWLRSFYQ
ncbi:MAG: CpsB/CapC family capsule biosynthesis tyrosine phosphatase [Methylocystis sp.]